MENKTTMSIQTRPKHVYQAFIQPKEINKFWFSSSSAEWQEGATIQITYQEYLYEGTLTIERLVIDKEIIFIWDNTRVHITIEPTTKEHVIVQVVQGKFDEANPDFLTDVLDNKEGWVYMLSCLKAYLENGITSLRAALVK